MLVLLDMAEVSSFGRLRQRTPLGASCLEIAGLYGIRSYAPIFFLTVYFQRERGEALLPVIIMGRILRFMVKLEVQNDKAAEFLRTSIRGSFLFADDVLA
jgi:hypothetical protein